MKGHKITHDEKETALEAMRLHGTMQYGAKVAGVDVKTLNNEMNRSAVFKRRVLEAREEGKRNMGDEQVEFIQSVAKGEVEVKMPRLTAALALANWVVPGFRGTTKVEGNIKHDIRIISAVPRPDYGQLPPKPEVREIESPKQLSKNASQTP